MTNAPTVLATDWKTNPIDRASVLRALSDDLFPLIGIEPKAKWVWILNRAGAKTPATEADINDRIEELWSQVAFPDKATMIAELKAQAAAERQAKLDALTAAAKRDEERVKDTNAKPFAPEHPEGKPIGNTVRKAANYAELPIDLVRQVAGLPNDGSGDAAYTGDFESLVAKARTYADEIAASGGDPIPDEAFDQAEEAARKMAQDDQPPADFQGALDPEDGFGDYSQALQTALEKVKPGLPPRAQMAFFTAATKFETFRAAWEAEEPEDVLIGKLQQFQRPQQRAEQPAQTNGHTKAQSAPQHAARQPEPKPRQAVKGNPFKRAVRENVKLRMALLGVSGAGKTFSALAIASAMFPDGKIAVLDTEHGSASRYADKFNFDVLELDSFEPEQLANAIGAAESYGYDVLIIDSFTHFWTGNNGLLEQNDKTARNKYKGNSFAAWQETTPEYRNLIDAILKSKIHVIATMRLKSKYETEADDRGKMQPKKVGTEAIQREGTEFEFDIVGTIDMASTLHFDNDQTKTRCSALKDRAFKQAGQNVADILIDWLNPAKPDQAA